jgi:hypothetical protein
MLRTCVVAELFKYCSMVLFIVDGQQEKDVDAYISGIYACVNVHFGCEF